MTRIQGGHTHHYVWHPPLESTCTYKVRGCCGLVRRFKTKHWWRRGEDRTSCWWRWTYCRSHPDKSVETEDQWAKRTGIVMNKGGKK